MSFFGTENPVGKYINYDNRWDYKIVGVMDELPGRSHFEYDVYLSSNQWGNSWLNNNFYTYFKLHPGSNTQKLHDEINAEIPNLVEPELREIFKL